MRLPHVLLTLAMVGCGSPSHVTTHDSNTAVDAPQLPPGCDYAELSDIANDNGIPKGATGTTEDTMTGGVGKVFCGNVDIDHFDATNFILDVDSYQFTMAADGNVRVDLYGPGLENLDIAEILLTTGVGTNVSVGRVGD